MLEKTIAGPAQGASCQRSLKAGCEKKREAPDTAKIRSGEQYPLLTGTMGPLDEDSLDVGGFGRARDEDDVGVRAEIAHRVCEEGVNIGFGKHGDMDPGRKGSESPGAACVIDEDGTRLCDARSRGSDAEGKIVNAGAVIFKFNFQSCGLESGLETGPEFGIAIAVFPAPLDKAFGYLGRVAKSAAMELAEALDESVRRGFIAHEFSGFGQLGIPIGKGSAFGEGGESTPNLGQNDFFAGVHVRVRDQELFLAASFSR
jgi:hypothetical protein